MARVDADCDDEVVGWVGREFREPSEPGLLLCLAVKMLRSTTT
jgi:hypothetical protein